MGRTKISLVFESDSLSPMEVIDSVFKELSFRKNDAFYPLYLRCDPLIEITDYTALDWRGRECSDTPKGEKK